MFMNKKLNLLLISSCLINFCLLYFLFQNSTQSSANIKVDAKQTNTIFVDIKGEIDNPGVYEMTSDDRLFTLIERAGGLTSEADYLNVNQSLKLTDEMFIIIPNKNEVNELQQAKRISINSAELEALCSLNGIGESKAKAIIDHREIHGPFRRLEDLLQVKGIGETTYNNIRDYITL